MTPAEKEQACKNLGVASNDQINRLEGEFIQLRGDMATVSSDVASAVANANSALASASDATTAAQAAIDSITGYATDLATVSSKADTNSGNITTLSSDISTLSANIGTISGKNISQDNKIGELSSSVAGLTNSAVYHEAVINNLTTAWTAYSADLRNDFNTFSAAEDAVITAATAAIPGQVSAEVSGQLSGKQDKLTPGVNISLAGNVIDVNKGGTCVASNGSVAIGYSTTAAGTYALSHGESTYAGAQAHAEGLYTSAMGSKSHSEGARTIANGQFSHSEGNQTSAIGSFSHAEGYKTISQGTGSHADGDRVSAVGPYSQALGKETLASGQYSFAVGNYARALGDESFANGTLTRAIGDDTHAEGVGTSAEGRGAHSEGHNTYTNGSYAHAEGEATRALGITTHAEGYQTSALGNFSHAEGSQTVTSGIYSHTEGVATIALGQFSHAEGSNTITDTNYQHVEGQYNAPATGALHVIGNGTSTANRSNIIETYTDRVVVNGNLNVSGTDFAFNNQMIVDSLNTLAKSVYNNYQVVFTPNTPTNDNNYILPKNDFSAYSYESDPYLGNTVFSAETSFWTSVGNYDGRFRVEYTIPTYHIERFNIEMPDTATSSRFMATFRNNSRLTYIESWGKLIVPRSYWLFYNCGLTAIPSSWDGFSAWTNNNDNRLFAETKIKDIPTDYTNYHLMNSSYDFIFDKNFNNCTALTGDIVPFMDWVLAEESANNKTYSKSACFAGCTGVPNYNTLTADSKYSAFF